MNLDKGVVHTLSRGTIGGERREAVEKITRGLRKYVGEKVQSNLKILHAGKNMAWATCFKKHSA